MKITTLEFAVLILVLISIYTVFRFSKKIDLEIEIKKITLENTQLENEIKHLEIRNKHEELKLNKELMRNIKNKATQ